MSYRHPPFEVLKDMFLIAGLGNPGKEYVNTRHNAGFMVIDKLAEKTDSASFSVKHKALITKVIIDGKKGILAKPVTFMNASGESLRELVDYYKPDKLIVVYDDITLDVGSIRVRKHGSAGGHNGMKSIISCLNTEEFERVRVGIGEKPPRMDLADWVLGHFPKEQLSDLDKATDAAVNALHMMLDDKTDEAMNLYNHKVERDQ